jgi:hypothetical protein
MKYLPHTSAHRIFEEADGDASAERARAGTTYGWGERRYTPSLPVGPDVATSAPGFPFQLQLRARGSGLSFDAM